MLMLVVQEISSNEVLVFSKNNFPKDPAMIVVYPTKALEEDMVNWELIMRDKLPAKEDGV